MDKLRILQASYGWLKAFSESVPTEGNISERFLNDYATAFSTIENLIDIDLSGFHPGTVKCWYVGTDRYCDAVHLRSKALQFCGFLNSGYYLDKSISSLGAMASAIHDEILRDRCEDLILSEANFDRAINQATLVLEDRIRKKANLDKTAYGTNLVNAAIKSKPNESILVLSNADSEQEGYANIIRGIMQALRNETHHNIVSNYSREDALSICIFIDRILRMIDTSSVKN